MDDVDAAAISLQFFNTSDGNGSSLDTPDAMSRCVRQLPDAALFIRSLSTPGRILLGVLVLVAIIVVSIYIEEVSYIMKTFKIGYRKKKTIWILACFPVWAVCGLTAVCVPKAGPLIDMVANMFFGTCLYNFGKLMVHYMGGPKNMWKIIGDERRINTNVLPVCCCCLCLPQMHFNRRNYFRVSVMILQVAIVRPILWFTAAVLWTNNSFYPGLTSPRHSYIYIVSCNLLSTMTAVYALMLLRNAFRPELEKRFFIMGKFASVQLSLVSGALTLLILAALIGSGTVSCGPLLATKGRADGIYHSVLVLIMLPLSLLGRMSFRRLSDGIDYAEPVVKSPPEMDGSACTDGDNGDETKTPLEAKNSFVVDVPFGVMTSQMSSKCDESFV
jgi:organic solute transporter subunit alpha